MRRLIALVLAIGLLLWPVLPAESVGLCGVFRTWNVGDTVTAADFNSSFTTAATTNGTWPCLGGYSQSVSQMQTATDPYTGGTESLAANGAGELERLRFVLARLSGWADWYRWTTALIDFTTGTGIQGSGLGRHVTAAGLHLSAGTATFPALTGPLHTTGIYWPLANHVALTIDASADNGRFGSPAGWSNARSYVVFHAAGLTMHHTMSLRFAHSEATMHNGQRGHVTAIRIDPATDSIVIGHSGAGLQIWGGPLSHITLGSGAYVALGRHMGTSIGTPVPNAQYADTLVKAWAWFDGQKAGVPVSQSFGLSSVTDIGVGDYTIAWQTAFILGHYAVGGFTMVPNSTTTGPMVGLVPSTTTMRITVANSAATKVDCRDCTIFAVGRQ